jgi:hypothetical protein
VDIKQIGEYVVNHDQQAYMNSVIPPFSCVQYIKQYYSENGRCNKKTNGFYTKDIQDKYNKNKGNLFLFSPVNTGFVFVIIMSIPHRRDRLNRQPNAANNHDKRRDSWEKSWPIFTAAYSPCLKRSDYV